ncbi:uncharacterized protein LOC131997170 [Stomoxys calcitrans]|uniref:uncharacterized protein LOC131997170 n=1 Tax=Stomoxys calcitrans TaxID=35570 RepID=UPI0027E3A653|nr:uncharacterized protein LOC131997170 [Stomoxys calcitrans]
MVKKIGVENQNTTSYHPQANEMIERVHRVLKTALTSQENQQWTRTLSTVLLGLRTAYKEDLKKYVYEIACGEVLRLPGDFLKENSDYNATPSEVFSYLHQSFGNVKPVPASRHTNQKSFVHKDLDQTSLIWIKSQTVKPLQFKYSGPYKVLKRND